MVIYIPREFNVLPSSVILQLINAQLKRWKKYEPHLVRGNVIYAGVDYEAILREAENDPNGCDVIVWDGGNNDFPFVKPDLMITVTDPHRAGHELRYYPGEVNLRLADVVLINKIDSSAPEDIQIVRESIEKVNPRAVVVDGASPIKVDDLSLIKGKKVLVVEDGPTLTHGEMKIGAGTVAARKYSEHHNWLTPGPF
jgi:predicted GTPase